MGLGEYAVGTPTDQTCCVVKTRQGDQQQTGCLSNKLSTVSHSPLTPSHTMQSELFNKLTVDSRSGSAMTLVPRLMPGRYLGFSCLALITSVSLEPCSIQHHQQQQAASRFCPALLTHAAVWRVSRQRERDCARQREVLQAAASTHALKPPPVCRH